tara:strand:+ start:50450 stop:50680 length:231 start_codon:yes stop_codon:yes gene_type:complete
MVDGAEAGEDISDESGCLPLRWRNWQVTKASVFQAFVLWDFDAFAKASSVTSTLKMQISHFDGCYRAKVLGGAILP